MAAELLEREVDDTAIRAPDALRRSAPGGRAAAVIMFAVTVVTLIGARAWWAGVVHAFFGRRSITTDARDFTAFYPAARLIAHGDAHRLYDLAVYQAHGHTYGVVALPATEVLPFLNPPFFGLALAPLGFLSFDHALQAWMLVNASALVLVLGLIWIASRGERPVFRAGLIALAITAQPVPFSLQLGQFSLLLLAAWAGFFLALRDGRPALAGACLALCLVKPELVVPVLLLLAWHRRWDMIGRFALFAAALAVVSLATIGPSAAAAYPGYVVRTSLRTGNGTDLSLMVGWNAVFDAAFHHQASRLANVLALPASGLTLVALVWSCRRSLAGGSHVSFAARWMLITIVAMLVDPHFYLQDATILIAPACFLLIAATGRARMIATAGVLGGWYVLALGFEPNIQWGVAVVPLYMFVMAIVIMEWIERLDRTQHGARTPSCDAGSGTVRPDARPA